MQTKIKILMCSCYKNTFYAIKCPFLKLKKLSTVNALDLMRLLFIFLSDIHMDVLYMIHNANVVKIKILMLDVGFGVL